MKALRCFSLLLSLSVVTALGDLSRPQNLSLQTLNTQYVLHWDWADDQQTAVNGTLTFTAQYLSVLQSRKAAHKQKWRTVCADVSERHCDFTDAGLNYWGIYYLRVRANTAQWFSSWTNISFCPDRDADLGPPSSVKLTSVKGDLEIVIADPLSSTNESMKTLAPDMHYLIQYWKKPEDYKKGKVLKTKNNVVTLSELDGSTWYCVRVQSCCDFYNKTSVFSDTHCTRTEDGKCSDCEMDYRWIFIAGVTAAVLVLAVIGYIIYKRNSKGKWT
ncbi:hypothetical protein ABG768_028192 [Culter alburnus]|uniref:Fibronectin type-III domain-containing protein n=1 Tax=Culter alburnus TaxID=194366 RepID=A0AAW2AB35_CULAL